MAPEILKLRSEDVRAHCLPLDMVLSALLYFFISELWVFPSKSALDSRLYYIDAPLYFPAGPIPAEGDPIRPRVHEHAVRPIGDLHMGICWLRPFDFRLLATRSQDRSVDQPAMC